MKKLIIIAVVLVAFITLAVLGYNYLTKNYLPIDLFDTISDKNDNSESNDSKVKAADFTVYDSDGNKVKLSSLNGKVAVVNFWATWCGPCKYELPDFNKAYEKYKDDVNFMMVNLTDGMRETESKVKNFLEENKYTFPVYYDKEGDGASRYGINVIPTTYIIDSEGYIINKHTGIMTESDLTGILDSLIN